MERAHESGGGRSADPWAAIDLRAGPVDLVLERGEVRWARLGSLELIRGVYAAIRDVSWGTVAPTFTRYEIDASSDAFVAQLAAVNIDHVQGVDFAWEGTIAGRPDGSITFEFQGAARRAFLMSRIGLCVLHPSRLAGMPLVVRSPWGELRGRFPDRITHVPPFTNIVELIQEPGELGEATITLDGDLFEMEDQRNWTDDSFKTFSTPQSLPSPILIDASRNFRQSVSIRPTQAGRRAAGGRRRETAPAPARLSIGRDIVGRLPTVGSCMAPRGVDLGFVPQDQVLNLHLDHLRGTVHASDPGWESEMQRLEQQAALCRASMEVALVASPEDPSIETVIRRVAESAVPISRVLIFDPGSHVTPAALVDRVRAALAGMNVKVALAGGSRAYFWHLSFAGVPVGLDAVAFPICPQVHASDDASILETPGALPEMVRAASVLAENLPVAVGPASLRPILDPYAPSVTVGGGSADPDGTYDDRQQTLLAAAWTAGSMSALAYAGVDSMTFHELAGEGGLIGGPHGRLDDAVPSRVLAVGKIVAALTSWPGAPLLRVTPPNGLSAIAVRVPDGTRIILANLTRSALTVGIRTEDVPDAAPTVFEALDEGDGGGGSARWIDALTRRTNAGDRVIDLKPFGVGMLILPQSTVQPLAPAGP